MGTKARIVIADDYPLSLVGLRQVIDSQPDLEVVSVANNGQDALESIRKLRPDVVVLDIGMPKMDGISVAKAVQKESLPVEIIFLTMYTEEKFFNRALEVGAKGYVLKESAANDIVSGIRAVIAGKHFTSPEVTTYLVKQKHPPKLEQESTLGIEDLTPTERRILRLLANYKTSKQIGEELFISRRTVEHHKANIARKLDVHGSYALMKFALEHKEH
jgi:DNA-binding NarL/FixJ family response regulator